MSVAMQTRGLFKQFGALTVADSIDFSLERGARHALIGPNGAGKTTFINMLAGRLSPSSGSIFLNGEDVTRLSQRARIRRGLGRTFQINALFRNLTALDNVALAVAERLGVAWQLFSRANHRSDVLDESRSVLETLGLKSDIDTRIADLSYGKQRLVEIAIALGMKPSVLLLDEPAAGVPTLESKLILTVLDSLPADLAILIIEHDMDLVFRFAKKITVLSRGALLAEGSPQEIVADSRVREVYLGERDV